MLRLDRRLLVIFAGWRAAVGGRMPTSHGLKMDRLSEEQVAQDKICDRHDTRLQTAALNFLVCGKP